MTGNLTDDSGRLGCAPLDSQHGLLAGLTDQLEGFIRAGTADAHLSQWLEDVWAFMVAHFATEDQLMAERNYPGLPEHRLAHDSVLNSLRELDHACQRRVEGTAARALDFVQCWQRNHVYGLDKDLAAFLADRSRS